MVRSFNVTWLEWQMEKKKEIMLLHLRHELSQNISCLHYLVTMILTLLTWEQNSQHSEVMSMCLVNYGMFSSIIECYRFGLSYNGGWC